MARTKKNKAREDRIVMEIVVDAHDEEEQAMGWYYYLEETEMYTTTHAVNTLWLLSNMFMVNALYKHKKTI